MKSPPVNDLLFTYGTLRRAAGNAAHRLLADQAVKQQHSHLSYLEANYPYLFSLAIRTSPLSCCPPEVERRDEPLKASAA